MNITESIKQDIESRIAFLGGRYNFLNKSALHAKTPDAEACYINLMEKAQCRIEELKFLLKDLDYKYKS